MSSLMAVQGGLSRGARPDPLSRSGVERHVALCVKFRGRELVCRVGAAKIEGFDDRLCRAFRNKPLTSTDDG